MTTTVIRHTNITDRIFATVITVSSPRGEKAFFQVYSNPGYMKEDNFDTILLRTESWSTASGAIEAMRFWVELNTSVMGTYMGVTK